MVKISIITHVGILVGVMLLAGILGGVVNYYLTRKDDPEHNTRAKCITVGLGASFLVPLFLNIIQSGLLKMGTDGYFVPHYLVFSGFCLIAAISSTVFVRSLSDRVLMEARAAKSGAESAVRIAEDVQSTIEPLANKETEEELTTEELRELMAEEVTHGLDDESKRLLRALGIGTHTFRSLPRLSEDTGIERPKVIEALTILVSKGLVGQAMRPKGVRWYLTEEGRKTLHTMG